MTRLEIAGKCFEWAMDHLALDEMGIYSDQSKNVDAESERQNFYRLLSEEAPKCLRGRTA